MYKNITVICTHVQQEHKNKNIELEDDLIILKIQANNGPYSMYIED